MNYKFLGMLDKDIADYWNICEHANKPIVVYEDRLKHVEERHITDFGSTKEIENIYNQLPNIIKKPDFTYYNKKTKGLEYYKYIKKDICVAVRINNGKVLKVKSWYPANDNKLANRKKKALEEELQNA